MNAADSEENKGNSRILIQQVTKFIDFLETDKPVTEKPAAPTPTRNGRTTVIATSSSTTRTTNQPTTMTNRTSNNSVGSSQQLVIHHKKFRLPSKHMKTELTSEATTVTKTTFNSNNNNNIESVHNTFELTKTNDKTANCDSNAKIMTNVTVTPSNFSSYHNHLNHNNQLRTSYPNSIPPPSSSLNTSTSHSSAKSGKFQRHCDVNPFLLHTDDLNRRFSIDSLLKQKKKSPH